MSKFVLAAVIAIVYIIFLFLEIEINVYRIFMKHKFVFFCNISKGNFTKN